MQMISSEQRIILNSLNYYDYNDSLKEIVFVITYFFMNRISNELHPINLKTVSDTESYDFLLRTMRFIYFGILYYTIEQQ